MQIIFWCRTRNTELLSNLIDGDLQKFNISNDFLGLPERKIFSKANDTIIILTFPSLDNKEIEPSQVIPFFESVKSELKNKNIFLFGSFRWGRSNWITTKESLKINYRPKDNTLYKYIQYYRKIA